MSADSAVQTVLSYYSLPPALVRRIESLGNAGGWSGSRIWKVEAVGNALRGVPGTAALPEFLCLRRWPQEHPTPERLRLIHDVLERVFQGGLHVVPVPLRTGQGTTFVEHEGHLWEVSPWMPGTADYHSQPNRARLRSAMEALAQFHQLAGKQTAIGHPQSIHDRRIQVRNYLGGLADTVPSGIRLGIDPRLDKVSGRVFDVARPMLTSMQAKLQAEVTWETMLLPAIRDIWHDHVLFTRDKVTGIVDFGALRIDTPLTDIARLVGSLVGNDREARSFALDTYAELRPLTNDDRRVINLLDESGVVLAGLNWLTWLYVDRRDMGLVEPIIRRLDEILRRLEQMPAR
jgi:homoserine kinase type II